MNLTIGRTWWKVCAYRALSEKSSLALILERNICTTPVSNRDCAGRYRPLEGRYQLLTYDQALKPHEIAHKKSWNSWNTSTVEGGRRSQLTTIEDMFIRKFIQGSFFGNVHGNQIIIKRQHNLVRVAFMVKRPFDPNKIYFMTGFSEEMLSIWLHCPVKIELQSVLDSEGYVRIVNPL